MKIRRVHERFYGRNRPGVRVCLADRNGRILYSAWRFYNKNRPPVVTRQAMREEKNQ